MLLGGVDGPAESRAADGYACTDRSDGGAAAAIGGCAGDLHTVAGCRGTVTAGGDVGTDAQTGARFPAAVEHRQGTDSICPHGDAPGINHGGIRRKDTQPGGAHVLSIAVFHVASVLERAGHDRGQTAGAADGGVTHGMSPRADSGANINGAALDERAVAGGEDAVSAHSADDEAAHCGVRCGVRTDAAVPAGWSEGGTTHSGAAGDAAVEDACALAAVASHGVPACGGGAA